MNHHMKWEDQGSPRQQDEKDSPSAASVSSGLRPLFTIDHGVEPTILQENITEVQLFKCAHLDDFADQPVKKYRNEFFRSSYNKMGYVKPVKPDEYVIADCTRVPLASNSTAAFLRAGARDTTVFHPSDVVAAIVTCGGLSPGLNSVIKTIVNTLYYNYSVDNIIGIQNGLWGFYTASLPPVKLDPVIVDMVSNKGGTILGSSRGGYDEERLVQAIKELRINQLYIVGGDGTHRAAHGISAACRKRNMRVCVAGIPKTIDNDIGIIDRSFGFTTALDESSRAVRAAVTEAQSYPRCIGMVKVMGRSAGFLAVHTTLSTECVDICLIPELPVDLNDVLTTLEKCIERDGYAIMVVAEGAGQDLCQTDETDASGNPVLGKIEDVLKREIKKHFAPKKFDYNLKFIDPSYMIRSVRANAFDQTLCLSISQNAVHGIMAGFTDFSSGLVNNKSCMIPLQIIFSCSPCSLNPKGRTIERMRIATQGAMDRRVVTAKL